MMPGGPGRTGRRRTMNNVLLPDDGHKLHNDPLYMKYEGNGYDDEDLDDYDDSYMEGNGSNFVTTEMQNSFDDDDEVDTKEGIVLPDSGEDEEDEESYPPPPMVQISSDLYNGGSNFNKNERKEMHNSMNANVSVTSVITSKMIRENNRFMLLIFYCFQSFSNSRSLQNNHQQQQQQQHQLRNKGIMAKYPVSTHILDTMNGVPAQGVSVSFYISFDYFYFYF